MSTYKPIDSKREEFRKYLEKTGVMDALTKALVALYEETDKPDDALGYIRSYLGGGGSEDPAKGLQKQMEDVKIKGEKAEGSFVKEGGEPAQDMVKPERESKTLGAGDADGPASSTRGSSEPVAESVPPDGVA